MNKTVAIAVAGALTLTLAPMSVFADDETPSSYTKEVQGELKQEADAKKAEATKMTPQEKVSAKSAWDAQTLKYQNMIEERTQNPPQRNVSINQSAEASKKGPMSPRGTINTPEAEKLLMKNKGQ